MTKGSKKHKKVIAIALSNAKKKGKSYDKDVVSMALRKAK